jgi:hypothetical protein
VRAELNRIDAVGLSTSPDGTFAPLVNARPTGLPAGTRAISLFGSRRSA